MTPNPNRLPGSPPFGAPVLGLSPVPVVERSPTGVAVIPQVLLKIAAVVVALAGAGVVIFTALMPGAGATVAPLPWVVTGLAICSSIVAVGASLGIVSQGVRSAAPPSSASSPRVGPPPQ